MKLYIYNYILYIYYIILLYYYIILFILICIMSIMSIVSWMSRFEISSLIEKYFVKGFIPSGNSDFLDIL